MTTSCACEHDGSKLIAACGLHAQWLRDNLEHQKATLEAKKPLGDEDRANLVRLLHQRYQDNGDTVARKAAWEIETLSDVEEPREVLAGKLIEAWVNSKGRQIPWAKAIQIIAIVTKQSNEERDKLLHLGDDDDGHCEMCGRADAKAAG